MNSDAFKAQLAALSAEYRATLPEKMLRVDNLWAQVNSGEADIGIACNDLLRELHTLAGSAKTFGLPEVSFAAKEAEIFLDAALEDGRLNPAFDRQAFILLLGVLQQKTVV